jgi:hypothetical protein
VAPAAIADLRPPGAICGRRDALLGRPVRIVRQGATRVVRCSRCSAAVISTQGGGAVRWPVDSNAAFM